MVEIKTKSESHRFTFLYTQSEIINLERVFQITLIICFLGFFFVIIGVQKKRRRSFKTNLHIINNQHHFLCYLEPPPNNNNKNFETHSILKCPTLKSPIGPTKKENKTFTINSGR